MSKGTELSQAVYGGVLDIDNSGSSPGVELLNFIFGVPEDFLLSPNEAPAPVKYGHHLARQLAHGPDSDYKPILNEILEGQEAEKVLKNLFASLQIQPPNVKRSTDSGWTRKPFFPFTKSLVHWDIKKSNKKIERVWMRGGGSLLHKILRKDDNEFRLEKIRDGFRALYKLTEGSALDRISIFFRDKSEHVFSSNPDEIETRSKANIDDFEDVYRNGVLNILEHPQLTTVGKVETLVNWSALWLVLMQYRRSCSVIERKDVSPIVCDCATTATAIRRISRKQFKHVFGTIRTALDVTDKKLELSLSDGQKNRIRGFFPSTASSVGLLNAYTGNRYFTLKVTTLETIVAALVKVDDETPFMKFLDCVLYKKLGIVVSRGAAKAAGFLEDYDGTIFENNEIGLASQMKASGLLTTYSDATQMVRFGR